MINYGLNDKVAIVTYNLKIGRPRGVCLNFMHHKYFRFPFFVPIRRARE